MLFQKVIAPLFQNSPSQLLCQTLFLCSDAPFLLPCIPILFVELFHQGFCPGKAFPFATSVFYSIPFPLLLVSQSQGICIHRATHKVFSSSLLLFTLILLLLLFETVLH